jgi:hypothetical protein
VGEFVSIVNGDNSCPTNPLDIHVFYTDGNMASIATMIPINISKTPRFVENVFIRADCSPEDIQAYTKLFKEFCDVFSWYYGEMPGIDPQIFEHEIMTYLDAKPV